MSTSSEETRNRAKSVVRSALAQKPEERARFIREACRNDVTLIREVESLLDSYERLEQRLTSSEGDAAALGRKIGKYEVLERVGQGAMGVVYKARDPLMRRLVGIKVMSAEIASDSELRKRFYGEARSAGNLSHKNIITIHDLGEDQGRPYIAMEFLSGEDLKSKLDRRAKITLEDRLRWMREMMEGLEHAHGKDVIHRDIKPANVFITREGEIKILDFGLARLTSSVATKTGHVMGTPSYMSPEQVRGDKTLDHRSDLFSAGSTFYEILSYQKPFPGDTIHGVFYKILESDPDPLRRLNPWLPEELEAIVSKAMAKERESRYQRAEEILGELRGVEASLGERKRALRIQALEALGEVESVLGAVRELARRMDVAIAADETMTVLLGERDPSEEPTVNEMLPQDYFGLVKTIVDARAETKRLKTELSGLEQSHRLAEQALEADARGNSTQALALADAALRLCPGHARAAALADRISRDLASHDSKWHDTRIGKLVAEGEERLEGGSLSAAGERFARAAALEPGNLRAAALKTKLVAAVDRERAKREAKEQAERLVAVARGKLAKDDDPAGCLELVRRALELDSDHSDARDLKDKAENRLAQQRSLAAEETAAEAIAAATLAMRRGDLTVAEKELARASRVNPSATEIPALTLLLERAQQATDATELVTRREREVRPRTASRTPPSPVERVEAVAPRPEARRGWMFLAGGAIVTVLAAVVGFRSLGTRELTAVPPDPAPTTASPHPATSTAPIETPAPPQTTVPSTTSVPPRSTSTVSTSSSSSIASTSTTSAIPTTTSAPVTTTIAVTTTAAAVAPPPPLSPQEQISELMRRYEAAYETLDVNALGAVYPSVPLSVKNSFRNFKTLELEMEPIAPPEVSRSTAGPTASAVYRIVQTVEPKVGKKTVSRHRASFLFAGVGTAWIIVRVDWEAE